MSRKKKYAEIFDDAAHLIAGSHHNLQYNLLFFFFNLFMADYSRNPQPHVKVWLDSREECTLSTKLSSLDLNLVPDRINNRRPAIVHAGQGINLCTVPRKDFHRRTRLPALVIRAH